MRTLKDPIADWTDIDVAEFHLATALGLMGPDTDSHRAKHVFWSNNPVGNMLYEIIKLLIEQRILETHPDDDTIVRWNANFVGSWAVDWRPDTTI